MKLLKNDNIVMEMSPTQFIVLIILGKVTLSHKLRHANNSSIIVERELNKQKIYVWYTSFKSGSSSSSVLVSSIKHQVLNVQCVHNPLIAALAGAPFNNKLK